MCRHDTLCQRLLQVLHGVSLVEHAEWWSGLKGAFAVKTDGVTTRAIRLREGFAALDRRVSGCCGQYWDHSKQEDN